MFPYAGNIIESVGKTPFSCGDTSQKFFPFDHELSPQFLTFLSSKAMVVGRQGGFGVLLVSLHLARYRECGDTPFEHGDTSRWLPGSQMSACWACFLSFGATVKKGREN
jgi:hypothetical protein